MLDFITHSAAQTVRIGQRLGELLHAGDLVLLHGNLGVGKTELVKGIVQGAGSADLVTSPSFVLVNEYQGQTQGRPVQLFHVDLYRLAEASEVTSIGLDDMLSGQDMCLIEWADRAADWLPAEHLAIFMDYLAETKRVLRFIPQGERYQQLVEAFKATTFA
jgi:tRNA threonylcarbamoyladenosine biosynthesis protein TsaE